MPSEETLSAPDDATVAAPRRLRRVGEEPIAPGMALPIASAESPRPVAAPARAERLVPKPVLSKSGRQAAAARAREAAKLVAPVKTSVLERKLAGLNDAQTMLQVMDTELALQRTRRLHDGGGSRHSIRVLSIVALVALLVAALAAMIWMQGRLARGGFSRHRAEMRARK